MSFEQRGKSLRLSMYSNFIISSEQFLCVYMNEFFYSLVPFASPDMKFTFWTLISRPRYLGSRDILFHSSSFHTTNTHIRYEVYTHSSFTILLFPIHQITSTRLEPIVKKFLNLPLYSLRSLPPLVCVLNIHPNLLKKSNIIFALSCSLISYCSHVQFTLTTVSHTAPHVPPTDSVLSSYLSRSMLSVSCCFL